LFRRKFRKWRSGKRKEETTRQRKKAPEGLQQVNRKIGKRKFLNRIHSSSKEEGRRNHINMGEGGGLCREETDKTRHVGRKMLPGAREGKVSHTGHKI